MNDRADDTLSQRVTKLEDSVNALNIGLQVHLRECSVTSRQLVEEVCAMRADVRQLRDQRNRDEGALALGRWITRAAWAIFGGGAAWIAAHFPVKL